MRVKLVAEVGTHPVVAARKVVGVEFRKAGVGVNPRAGNSPPCTAATKGSVVWAWGVPPAPRAAHTTLVWLEAARRAPRATPLVPLLATQVRLMGTPGGKPPGARDGATNCTPASRL